MRNLRIFAKQQDYKNYLFEEIFKEKLISRHPFYRNLIEFMADSKAPVFYNTTDPAEDGNFSNYFNFQVIRDRDTDPTISTMFHLHEFTHTMNYFPGNPSSITLAQFIEYFKRSEYMASNESEILLHYRVPQLREKVFQDKKIFIDVMKEHGMAQPTAADMYKLRTLLIETGSLDDLFFADPSNSHLRGWFGRFRDANDTWARRWFPQIADLNLSSYPYRWLEPATYEPVIASYLSTTPQAEYERIVVSNVNAAATVLKLEERASSIDEAIQLGRLMEDKPLLCGGGDDTA